MSTALYAINKYLNYEFGGTSYTPPATWYIGLSTTSTGSSGSAATEPTDPGYARVAVTNNHTTGFSTATAGSLVNSGSIIWNQSNVSWGTIVDIVLYDLSSGGNVWHYQALSSPRAVSGSSVVQFLPGALTISMT
jgi:hypothetical protein